MPESIETIPKEHVELLSRIIKLEVKLENIADKLDKIILGLENVIKAHNDTKTAVEGYGQTIKRHNDEIIELAKRLRFLEKAYWVAIGILGALNILISLPKIVALFV